ncbi:DinB family protein [Flavobacterium sp.]|uniref:DinB family protein n=1 Tax=Flavobacterium sp. TaxID=239 RepID=UPI0038FC8537
MEIKTIASFLSYYDKIREGTKQIIQVIPEDKMDWTYKSGKFTIADVIRHIAAIERNVFAELVIVNPACYEGCGKELADGYENVITYFNEMHSQSMQIFRTLNDVDLNRKIVTLSGSETKIGNFLRALIIHEIHHCGALCIYLNLLDVKTPSIFGLTEEQVIEKSKSFENSEK